MAIVRFDKEDITTYIGDIKNVKQILDMLGAPTEIEEEIVVEVNPNRPDLLTFGGLMRAVKQREGKKIESNIHLEINENIKIEEVKNRPYCFCGYVRTNKPLPQHYYDYLIQAQEKLHETIGRKRKKVAIGIHDLNKVKLPITYKPVEDISFIPLNWEKKANINEILTKHEKGVKYAHLVKDKPYPMLFDSEGVISFPPIINSDRTKLSETTKNFFIDVTGTHLETTITTFFIILHDISMFSDNGVVLCNETVYKQQIMPWINRGMEFNEDMVREINKLLGLNLSKEHIKDILQKMDYRVDEKNIVFPMYRYDIMDITDVVEDVAIGFGYDKLEPINPEIYTIGKQNKEAEKEIFTNMGFKEIKTFFLTNREEEETYFKDNKKPRLTNSLNENYNDIRSSLFFSLLKIEEINKMKKLPHKIFEIGHVFKEKEKKQIGFLIANKKVKIEEGIGVLKRYAQEIGKQMKLEKTEMLENSFYLWKVNGFIGRSKCVVGIVHPKYLTMYNIPNVVLIGLIE